MRQASVLSIAGIKVDCLVGPGISKEVMAELSERVAIARARAQLSPRAFLALNGRALRAFCAEQNLDVVEMALVQAMAAQLWDLRRMRRLTLAIARAAALGQTAQ